MFYMSVDSPHLRAIWHDERQVRKSTVFTKLATVHHPTACLAFFMQREEQYFLWKQLTDKLLQMHYFTCESPQHVLVHAGALHCVCFLFACKYDASSVSPYLWNSWMNREMNVCKTSIIDESWARIWDRIVLHGQNTESRMLIQIIDRFDRPISLSVIGWANWSLDRDQKGSMGRIDAVGKKQGHIRSMQDKQGFIMTAVGFLCARNQSC
jgi:hypothetical protein